MIMVFYGISLYFGVFIIHVELLFTLLRFFYSLYNNVYLIQVVVNAFRLKIGFGNILVKRKQNLI